MTQARILLILRLRLRATIRSKPVVPQSHGKWFLPVAAHTTTVACGLSEQESKAAVQSSRCRHRQQHLVPQALENVNAKMPCSSSAVGHLPLCLNVQHETRSGMRMPQDPPIYRALTRHVWGRQPQKLLHVDAHVRRDAAGCHGQNENAQGDGRHRSHGEAAVPLNAGIWWHFTRALHPLSIPSDSKLCPGNAAAGRWS